MATRLPGRKFVHKQGILCTKLAVAGKFVHKKGILCTKQMRPDQKFDPASSLFLDMVCLFCYLLL